MRCLFNEKRVRNVPLDEIPKHIATAIEDERFEDVITLKAEQERRKRFRESYQSSKKNIPGPWYVWYDWAEPISDREMRRSNSRPEPPYATFRTHLEASEWLQIEEVVPK